MTSNRNLLILTIVVSILAMLIAGEWYRTRDALQLARAELTGSTLAPMAALISENVALIHELQSEQFAEPNSGVLESYLTKIRRDGVPKNANMKLRLDQLAENNTAIVTLIRVYGPNVKTLAYTTEAEKFRTYAAAWRDRWNSVMELYMAGGNYPVTEISFPAGFADAVQLESKATLPMPYQ